MREAVEKALEKAREYVRVDGGDIDLVDVTEEGVVKIKFKGACAGCPMGAMTLKNIVAQTLEAEVPGVTSVEAVENDS